MIRVFEIVFKHHLIAYYNMKFYYNTLNACESDARHIISRSCWKIIFIFQLQSKIEIIKNLKTFKILNKSKVCFWILSSSLDAAK